MNICWIDQKANYRVLCNYSSHLISSSACEKLKFSSQKVSTKICRQPTKPITNSPLVLVASTNLYSTLLFIKILLYYLSNIYNTPFHFSSSSRIKNPRIILRAMKNTIRCCISCILPCGALDVIRVVHSNGHVEEISGTIRAAEIMKLNPRHMLKKPSSPSDDHTCPKMVVLPPDAELQRGKIYFLIPLPKAHEKSRSRSSSKKKRRVSESNNITVTNLLINSDQYLSEILSEKVSVQRDRRGGRTGVWRPHLESISEAASDT